MSGSKSHFNINNNCIEGTLISHNFSKDLRIPLLLFSIFFFFLLLFSLLYYVFCRWSSQKTTPNPYSKNAMKTVPLYTIITFLSNSTKETPIFSLLSLLNTIFGIKEYHARFIFLVNALYDRKLQNQTPTLILKNRSWKWFCIHFRLSQLTSNPWC